MQYSLYTKILIKMSNKLKLEFQQLCKTIQETFCGCNSKIAAKAIKIREEFNILCHHHRFVYRRVELSFRVN